MAAPGMAAKALIDGGEEGIRTLGTFMAYTHFPGVLLKPLGHLSDDCLPSCSCTCLPWRGAQTSTYPSLHSPVQALAGDGDTFFKCLRRFPTRPWRANQ